MAYFSVEQVQQRVGAKATGRERLFRGKNRPALVFTVADEGLPQQALTDAGFGYVVAKLAARGTSMSWASSEVSKLVLTMLEAKPAAKPKAAKPAAKHVDPELEAAKAKVAEANAARKATAKGKRDAKKEAFQAVAANQPSIEQAMVEAERENAKGDLLKAIAKSNLSKAAKASILALI